jgi:cytochrome c-type biogenesis protein CcmH/NrfF
MERHDVDPVSLTFGLLFTIVGLMLLNDPTRSTVWLGWAGPAVAIGLGLLVVLAVRPRRAKPDDEAPTSGEG